MDATLLAHGLAVIASAAALVGGPVMEGDGAVGDAAEQARHARSLVFAASELSDGLPLDRLQVLVRVVRWSDGADHLTSRTAIHRLTVWG